MIVVHCTTGKPPREDSFNAVWKLFKQSTLTENLLPGHVYWTQSTKIGEFSPESWHMLARATFTRRKMGWKVDEIAKLFSKKHENSHENSRMKATKNHIISWMNAHMCRIPYLHTFRVQVALPTRKQRKLAGLTYRVTTLLSSVVQLGNDPRLKLL